MKTFLAPYSQNKLWTLPELLFANPTIHSVLWQFASFPPLLDWECLEGRGKWHRYSQEPMSRSSNFACALSEDPFSGEHMLESRAIFFPIFSAHTLQKPLNLGFYPQHCGGGGVLHFQGTNQRWRILMIVIRQIGQLLVPFFQYSWRSF